MMGGNSLIGEAYLLTGARTDAPSSTRTDVEEAPSSWHSPDLEASVASRRSSDLISGCLGISSVLSTAGDDGAIVSTACDSQCATGVCRTWSPSSPTVSAKPLATSSPDRLSPALPTW